jgi:hypothetical protein
MPGTPNLANRACTVEYEQLPKQLQAWCASILCILKCVPLLTQLCHQAVRLRRNRSVRMRSCKHSGMSSALLKFVSDFALAAYRPFHANMLGQKPQDGPGGPGLPACHQYTSELNHLHNLRVLFNIIAHEDCTVTDKTNS